MRSRVSLIGVLILVAACAAPKPSPAPDNVIGKDFKAPPAGSLIVLLPAPQSKGLEAGDNFMAAQLPSQLKSAGFRVSNLNRSNYNEIWAQEVAAVGGIFDPATGAARPQARGTALSRLARRVCEELQCAMIIEQSLQHRTAKLDGTTAEWDGQFRPIPVKDNTGREHRFSGTTAALSVELVAVMANGSLGFRTFGGVTLPFQANMQESKNELRRNLFANDQEVAEAVKVALEPLLRR